MNELYQDSMSIVREYGRPSLFITMTTNTQWDEIQVELLPGQTANDRPDVIVRVFSLKLRQLISEIKDSKIFGDLNGITWTVEFQKRGLPHAHILVFLCAGPTTPDEIDSFVCAELPQNNTRLLHQVLMFMTHGPCNSNSICWKHGRCSKRYPKNFHEETSINENGDIVYRRRPEMDDMSPTGQRITNADVVPYNPYLISRFNCHINTEICNSIKSVKYLFKYIFKGADTALAEIENEQTRF